MLRILILLFFSFSAVAQSILMIGDSHMATDFGKLLYQEVRTYHQDDLVMMGHASSAPKDWIGSKNKSFNNVIYHNAHINQQNYPIPEWSMKYGWHSVPKISQLLRDMRYRKAWKTAAYTKPDIVLIELGANDLRVISHDNGKVIREEFKKRIQYIRTLISEIRDAGAKCFWVGPPMGRRKSLVKQETLYKMLRKAIGNRCAFFESNMFKATKCPDGVHFNCHEDRPEALKWAKAVSYQFRKFIQ